MVACPTLRNGYGGWGLPPPAPTIPTAPRLGGSALRPGPGSGQARHPHAARILVHAWRRVIWACWHPISPNPSSPPCRHHPRRRGLTWVTHPLPLSKRLSHAAPLTGLPSRASRFLAACPGGPGLTGDPTRPAWGPHRSVLRWGTLVGTPPDHRAGARPSPGPPDGRRHAGRRAGHRGGSGARLRLGPGPRRPRRY